MGGRGPEPHFHRTVRPLPKAKSTGGGHGAAFPSPNPNPSSKRPHTRDQSRQARTPMGQIGLGWLWGWRWAGDAHSPISIARRGPFPKPIGPEVATVPPSLHQTRTLARAPAPHRDQIAQAKTPMARCRVGMASGLEMGGRGPQPHAHRTVRPLPKANRTGGGHGAAFPPPDPNPSPRAGTTEMTRVARPEPRWPDRVGMALGLEMGR